MEKVTELLQQAINEYKVNPSYELEMKIWDLEEQITGFECELSDDLKAELNGIV